MTLLWPSFTKATAVKSANGLRTEWRTERSLSRVDIKRCSVTLWSFSTLWSVRNIPSLNYTTARSTPHGLKRVKDCCVHEVLISRWETSSLQGTCIPRTLTLALILRPTLFASMQLTVTCNTDLMVAITIRTRCWSPTTSGWLQQQSLNTKSSVFPYAR